MARGNGRLDLGERLRILRRDEFKCSECGRGGQSSDWILEVDHINGNGYDHWDKNLQTLCVECHNNKHPWRWLLPQYKVFRFSERRKATIS